MKLFFLLVLVAVGVPYCAFSGVLKGTITDTKGNKLPYASVYVKGTTTGVSANGDGNYELTIAAGTYEIICQYVGYKQSSFALTIKENEEVRHNFTLRDLGLEMKEVVIHADAEDPAYDIIRQAIKRRKFHLEQVKSFQTSIYLKAVARSRKMPDKIFGQKVRDEETVVDSAGKGVLYLAEEDAAYYTENSQERTVIHSVHESGSSNGLGFSRFPPVITFYENDISIFGKASRGFISPVSDNALNYYKYKLLGQFEENGNAIYKIQLTRKRDYEPCFNGIIYIVDSEWAIHSLNVELDKRAGIDVWDTLKIDQLYLPLNKDTWVIKNQVLYVTINLMGLDITGTGVTVYNNQKVNEPIPDSIFRGKVTSSYDKQANKKDTSYWTQLRPIPLQSDEIKDFVVKDSLYKKLESPEHTDSVRHKQNKIRPLSLLTGGASFNTKGYKDNISIGSLSIGGVNYNTVEGLYLEPKVRWRRKLDSAAVHTLSGTLFARYGFSNTHFNAIAKLSYSCRDTTWLGRYWTVGVQGGKYVFQYDPDNPVNVLLNSIYTLFWHENDLKIYERWDATVFASRNYGNGWKWNARLSYQQRIPLNNTTNYSFDGLGSRFIPNEPVALTAYPWVKSDAVLCHLSLSYKPGYTYTQYPDYKIGNDSRLPLFTLSYDKGIPGILNSVVNYDKWRFSIRQDVALKLLGSFSYNIAVGGFLNSNYVSLPDLMHLYGNRGIGFASPYLTSFQFAPFYDFSNDEPFYGEGHFQYNLNGLLSNKIPLLRQARFYLVFGDNTFYARQSDYYTEAFIGIDNIGWKMFRFLRVDFVQSWDSHGSHNSGIRVGINWRLGTISVSNDKDFQ